MEFLLEEFFQNQELSIKELQHIN